MLDITWSSAKKHKTKLEKLWQEWLDKQKPELKYKTRERNYYHFDRKISLYDAKGIPKPKIINKLKASFIICPLSSIPPHSFYPFIYFEINSRKYKFDSNKDKGIYKPKTRPISYASHFDSLIFSWYSHLIGSKYETKLKDFSLSTNIIAYRPIDRKSTIDFAKDVFDFIKSKDDYGAIALDITGFFDNIDHQILKESISIVLNEDRLPKDIYSVFKAITGYSIIEKEFLLDEFGRKTKKSSKKLFRNNERICSPKQLRQFLKDFPEAIFKNLKKKGIPQGSPISALFSNIYLIQFDKFINEIVSKYNGLYRRYSDDIIIIIPNNKIQEFNIIASTKIKEFKLTINESKTEINFFSRLKDGKLACVNSNGEKSKVQYLGFNFNGEDVQIRASSMARYYKKVRMSSKKIVSDLYSEKNVKGQIFKKAFYSKYSTRGLKKGKSNFIGYMKLADFKINSKGIKKQYSKHFTRINQILQEEIDRKKDKIIKFIER